jgi:rhodanese-related sulfurtransferase
MNIIIKSIKILAISSLFFISVNAADSDKKGACKNLETKKMATDYLNKSLKEIKELNSLELNQMIKNKEKFLLIDLRTERQFERGSIDHEELHNIDRGYLEFHIEEFAKNHEEKIVLYCCSGKRSAVSAKDLQEMGYTNVYSLKGGMIDWVDSKLPIITQYGYMKLYNENQY